MQLPPIARRLAASVVAIALFTLSGGIAWAVADDLGSSDVMPSGASVIKLDGELLSIGGLTRAEARSLLETNIVDPAKAPVLVRTPRGLRTLDASGLVSVDVDAILDAAIGIKAQTPLLTRLVDSMTGDPATTTVEPLRPVYSVDSTAVVNWVKALARSIDTKPVNASRKVVGSRLVISPARTGVRTNQPSAVATIGGALTATEASRTVSLPTTVLKPSITEKSFGRTIVVDRSERRLYLYRYAKLEKKYRVAIGTPGYPTPLGQFTITLKRYLPTWSNPGSDWAEDMPAYIPPGPGNPLGTRALNLSVSGIRIHGTNKVNSIGTAASHGCVRMLRADIEQLYTMVQVGTVVYVVQ